MKQKVLLLVVLIALLGLGLVFTKAPVQNSSQPVGIATTPDLIAVLKERDAKEVADAEARGDKYDPEKTVEYFLLGQGDINGDGATDALVKQTTCGASCGIGMIVLYQGGRGAYSIEDLTIGTAPIITSGADMTDLQKVSIDPSSRIITITGRAFSDSKDLTTTETRDLYITKAEGFLMERLPPGYEPY